MGGISIDVNMIECMNLAKEYSGHERVHVRCSQSRPFNLVLKAS